MRYFQESELLEDVFTMNDFGFPLRPPNHPLYLNTEFVGHTYPTKMYRQRGASGGAHRRHARVHDQLAIKPAICRRHRLVRVRLQHAREFGSGDRICYHGVSDIFRLPKPAGDFYKSQCDPAEEVVLEPAFLWAAAGDYSQAMETAIICSNCDHLKLYVGDKLVTEVDPDRKTFGNLPHPPFNVDLHRAPKRDILRIEGYLGGNKAIEKRFSHLGIDREFEVTPDDTNLRADGADSTRIVLRVTDEFGSLMRYSTAAIAFSIDGPAEIVGDNPFSLTGGCGAIWIRARHEAETATLKATHPVLGTREVRIEIGTATGERV